MTLHDYPQPLENLDARINLWAQLKTETGAAGVADKVAEINAIIAEKLAELRALPDDPALSEAEPNDLEGIRALRPAGERRYWNALPEAEYRDRLQGAIFGRFAGCVLGSIVECWEIDKMEGWAAYLGEAFPPQDYWTQAERPQDLKYRTCLRDTFTRDKMDGVPTDDDIIYTQLGMLILEDHGADFSLDDVGAAWMKYLPHAATAEGIALANLHNDVPAKDAAAVDNPFMHWIGADIRSDPWGYAAPGYPEKAAAMAWTDASISHRRNGIYGAMYFSAAIAAAFALGDPMAALEAALSEIPADCVLAREVRWALDQAGSVKDYRQARAMADERYAGMHRIHTINNAALTIWGLAIGGRDFTKVIGETVAMGLDNDCTAATAGSIFGAAYGSAAIPDHWTRGFNNKVYSYIIGIESFALDDMIDRYTALAKGIVGA